MSRIYAAGVKLTALSNILADLEDYFSFNAAGQLVLDKAGLEAYLREELLDVAATEFVYPADATTATAAAQAANVGALVTELDNKVNVAHFSQRTDWPTTTATLTGGQIVAAVAQGQIDLKYLSDRITNHYETIKDQLADLVARKYYEMGVDTAVPPGITRIISTRSYIVTFVTDWGEESKPSPAADIQDLDENDTTTVTRPALPADNEENITHWRLYRSNASGEGADWQFVAEVPIATLTYADEKIDKELDETCPSLTWDPPPENLAGLVAMPNKFLAGGFGDTLAFSEPNHPYAWPPEYWQPLGAPFVAAGVVGQTVVALTRGRPRMFSGADPGSMAEVHHSSHQACVSARSVVSTRFGVVWASPDGLCLADGSSITVITEAHWTREDWQALVPSSIFAAESEGCYYFWYDNGTTSGCYSLDLRTGKLVSISATASTVFADPFTDTLYIAAGTTIKALFNHATRRTATWRTKIIVFPAREGFAWLQVESEFEAAVTVKLYRGGTLYHTVAISSRTPVRVPDGEHTDHEIQIESQAKVTGWTLASSLEDLVA